MVIYKTNHLPELQLPPAHFYRLLWIQQPALLRLSHFTENAATASIGARLHCHELIKMLEDKVFLFDSGHILIFLASPSA